MSRSQAAGATRHTVDASHARSAASAREPRRSQRTGDTVTPAPVSNQAMGRALGSGTPLEPAVRAEMEARFGESFADVRIHDDAAAHRSAAQLDAKAYTRGTDVAFSEGRYAPDAPDGRHLLAHELAHVVQQRRGGPAPELSPSARHEAAADQAATQVAAGASGVSVSGATGVGVAREVDDEKKKAGSTSPFSSQGLPLGDASRVLTPGPEYWLRHEPNLGAMKPLELRDEANEINEWIFRQTQSTPDMARLELVRDRLAQAATQQLHEATAVPKRSRRHGGKRHAATPAPAPGPRAALAQRHASTRDPAVLAENYNTIVNDLRRKDLTPQERSGLQLELDSIAPLVDDDLARRSALRHANVVDEALMPEDRYYGKDSPMIERMRRIDRIKADSETPGMNYLMHGRERIPITDDMVRAIRAGTMRQLSRTAIEAGSANDEVMADYREFVDRTFDEHPVVGLISMIRSAENPLDWEGKLLSLVAGSNLQAGSFEQQRRATKDPWNAAPPKLEQMARDVESSLRQAENARNYLDYKTGLVLEGTAGAIRHLGRMKTAGQVAASIAFTPLGGALYAAGGSTAEQLMRMHYGQQEEFDFAAPVIDAVASYVGGKVTGGLTGGLGKNAPLWLRAAAFVPADRLGAAATTITHGGLERATGRSTKGFGEIMGEAASDLTDWKQAGINLFTAGLSHSAHSSRGRKGSSKQAPPVPASGRDAPGPAAAPHSPTIPVPTDTPASPHSLPEIKASTDNAPSVPIVGKTPELAKPAAQGDVTGPAPKVQKPPSAEGELPAGFHEEAIARTDETNAGFGSGFGKKTQKKMAEGAEGKGQRELGPHIDEPLPVGDRKVSLWRRYQRATDPQNRQFLDPATNSQTKHLGVSREDIARNRNPMEPVSLATPGVPASVVFTRRFGEVVELRTVVNQAFARIRDPYKHSPGKVKEMVNDNIKEIIREGKSPEGIAVRDALRTLGYEYLPGKGLTAVKPRAAGVKPPPTETVE
jgi:hypothetical protein